MFIGLNPSTADATRDDPTSRRCVAFARREGAGRLELVNLFALRATDPLVMKAHPAPEGPDNDAHLLAAVGEALAQGGRVVLAWGNHGRHRDGAARVLRLLGDTPLHALAVNVDGSPRHPMYVRRDAPLRPWRPR